MSDLSNKLSIPSKIYDDKQPQLFSLEEFNKIQPEKFKKKSKKKNNAPLPFQDQNPKKIVIAPGKKSPEKNGNSNGFSKDLGPRNSIPELGANNPKVVNSNKPAAKVQVNNPPVIYHFSSKKIEDYRIDIPDSETGSIKSNSTVGNKNSNYNDDKVQDYYEEKKNLISEAAVFNSKKAETGLFKSIDFRTFKTNPCPNKDLCTDDFCKNYHYLGEKRRFPVTYSEIMCRFKASCQNGQKCNFSHNFTESFYHPNTFKVEKNVVNGNQEVKKNNENLGDSDSLKEEFKQLVEINKSLSSEFENKKVVLARLKNKIFCQQCTSKKIGITMIPCGHSFCTDCAKNKACLKCHSSSNFIKLKS